MLQAADPSMSDADADARVSRALSSGDAYEKFVQWAIAQGAESAQFGETDSLPSAPDCEVITADRSGFVAALEPRAIGTAALRVGAGRLVQHASIDPGAGVVLHRRVGDPVRSGDVLAEVHHSDRDTATAVALVRSAFVVTDDCPSVPPVIHQVL